ncbi:SAM-dependent methyltransferase [Leptolyngbya sp. AN02str]|uniref:SAM-dependent methyltransferase n=1 Tax=Leptolyngbya sp. AN02str TaxID=3423363 RepID=UPI003D320EF9
MAMQLENVVPFGRSLDEYSHMFNLSEQDLQKQILGVGDGPASFNAEGTRLGYRITSIDPLYKFTASQIRDRFTAVVEDVIGQIERSPNAWVWSYHSSPAHLRTHRERVTELFCQDFEQGQLENRYRLGELPHLPYPNHEFELGLCSHFLFLYSEHFDEQFHLDSVRELLRVCREVRIFPLLTLMRSPSPHLPAVLSMLRTNGYQYSIQTVAYELQRGGNQMLQICRPPS